MHLVLPASPRSPATWKVHSGSSKKEKLRARGLGLASSDHQDILGYIQVHSGNLQCTARLKI